MDSICDVVLAARKLVENRGRAHTCYEWLDDDCGRCKDEDTLETALGFGKESK
jgi:hypothetical protein